MLGISSGLVVAGVTVVALGCATQAKASIITDGTFTNASNQATLVGWTSTVGVNAATESNYVSCCNAVNPGPNNLAAFGSGQTSGGTMSQAFATIVGQAYHLSFLYGSFGDNETQSLAVTVGNLSTSVSDSTGSSNFSNLFNVENFTFTALASTSTLTFHDVSNGGSSADGLLEDVVANAATTVPEPASLALLGLGLASIYATRRRACQ